jgi:hypothetical protein
VSGLSSPCGAIIQVSLKLARKYHLWDFLKAKSRKFVEERKKPLFINKGFFLPTPLKKEIF